MEALLAFGAALLTLRLAGSLLGKWRERRDPQLAAWAGGLAAYAVASAALAWGAASGWSDPAFRVYYLFGGLLTAALLGVGSLLLAGKRWAAPLGLLYAGLAVGVAIAVPLTAPVTGDSIPGAQEHLDFWPEAARELIPLVASGKLKYRETIAEGLAAAPAAFSGLLHGKNVGKQLVKLV